MKFRLFAIVAILFSIAFANARKNKRRDPAAGKSSAKINVHAADGAHVISHVNKENVCDGKKCDAKKNVCHKHIAMGATTYECIANAKAAERYPKVYNADGTKKDKKSRRRY